MLLRGIDQDLSNPIKTKLFIWNQDIRFQKQNSYDLVWINVRFIDIM